MNRLNRLERMIIAGALAALTMLPIAAFILLRDDGGSEAQVVQRGCSAEERAVEATYAATPNPTPLGPVFDVDELNRLSRASSDRPYVGMLCGFEIVANSDEAHANHYCIGKREGRGGHSPLPFLDSELNRPGMTEQAVCDGEVIATYGSARRSYFRGAPKLDFGVNREYLRIVQIDGHDVLYRTSPTPPFGVYLVAVVQRWPEGDKPGILVATMAGGPNEVERVAREALAQ
jgi:hypothetical protein